MSAETPLSYYANDRFNSLNSDKWGHTLWPLIIGLLAGVIITIAGRLEKASSFYCAAAVSITFAVLWRVFMHNKFRKKRQAILTRNERDYLKSLALKEVLTTISGLDLEQSGKEELALSGEWKPFRVEHFISSSLRSQIEYGCRYPGSFSGAVIPNLLDSSSVLFLQDGNDAMRVLIPSPKAVKEFFIKLIEVWEVSELISPDDHCHALIQDFRWRVEREFSLSPQPNFIDKLDSSCQLPLAERPVVKIRGEKVQEGVYLVSSLKASGEEAIFFPAGYFKKVTGLLVEAIGKPHRLGSVKILGQFILEGLSSAVLRHAGRFFIFRESTNQLPPYSLPYCIHKAIQRCRQIVQIGKIFLSFELEKCLEI